MSSTDPITSYRCHGCRRMIPMGGAPWVRGHASHDAHNQDCKHRVCLPDRACAINEDGALILNNLDSTYRNIVLTLIRIAKEQDDPPDPLGHDAPMVRGALERARG